MGKQLTADWPCGQLNDEYRQEVLAMLMVVRFGCIPTKCGIPNHFAKILEMPAAARTPERKTLSRKP